MYKNLSEVIKDRVKSESKIVFINEKNDKQINYKDIYDKALYVLYNLQNKGLKPGDKLILITEKDEDFIYLFWACVLGNIIPVPIIPKSNQEGINTILKIWDDLKRPIIAVNSSIIENLSDAVQGNSNNVIEEFIKNIVICEQLMNSEIKGRICQVQASDIAVIQFSSGSTGDPKGVILTHENLIANIIGIVEGGNISERDSSLSWMPLTHDMGLIGFHLTPLFVDCDHYLMSPLLFLKNPLLWISKASEYSITILVSPNFGYKHFLTFYNHSINQNWNLENVRLIFNGAEPISTEYCIKFIDSMKTYNLKGSAMFPVYGLAEATLAVTFPPIGEGLKTVILNRNTLTIGKQVEEINATEDYDCAMDYDNAVEFVDLGYGVRGCEIRICDKECRPLPENTVGCIQVKGKNITEGYYENEIATSKLFTEDFWLITGDLGFIRNGRLIVTGREKDIIFINGQNYYPDDIERVITNIIGLERTQVVVSGVFNKDLQKDDIVAFLQFDGELRVFAELRDKVKRIFNRRTGLDISQIIPIKNIPKTASGKAQRYKLVQNYEDDIYNEVITSLSELKNDDLDEMLLKKDLSETEVKLAKIFTDILSIRGIGAEDSFFELGGNSIKATSLIMRINHEFNIDISLNALFNNSTIHKLARFIEKSNYKKAITIERAEHMNYYPALPSQQRLYILNQLDSTNTNYNLPAAIVFEGDFNYKRFEEAFRELINRHESLRTTFDLVKGQLIQKVHDHMELELTYIEVPIGGMDVQDIINKFIKPFNITEGPLFRAEVARLNQQKHLFMIDFHHIITDGTSLGILLRDISYLYREIELPQIKYQFKDYSVWKKQMKNSQWHKEQENFWVEHLRDEIPILNMPTDYPRPLVQSFDGDMIHYRISEKLSDRLREYASKSNSTLYMVLLAAYNVLLSKYTNQEDIIVGSPITGRFIEGFENTTGMFINTLPIRSKPNREKKFRQLLQEVRENTLEANKYQGYQLEELLQKLNVHSDLNRNPIFDTVFNMQNMEIPQVKIGDRPTQIIEYNSKSSKLDITVEVREVGNILELAIEYCVKLFKRETMDRFAAHYSNILERITENPDTYIGDIDIMCFEEKKQIIEAFNNTEKEYFKNTTINELLDQQTLKSPERTALIFDNVHITYKELGLKRDKLAVKLRSNGVKPDDIVGIMVGRGPDRIIGLLGILKSGGAYLPIEPDYPLERISYMIEDSKIDILITEPELSDNISFNGKIINIHEIDEDIECLEEINNVNKGEDLAYIIYTSGTTGRPKGIMVEHRNLLAYVRAFENEFNIIGNERFLQQASYSFDAFVEEVYPALINGSAVVLARKEEIQDIEFLAELINRNSVTMVSCSPLLLNELNKQSRLSSIHTYIGGGDVLKYEHINKLIEYADVYNTYGPTETTVCATYYKYNKDEIISSIPIGKPIANYKVYILDTKDNLLPVGIPGQLCIAGEGITRGYLNKPELSEEKYIINPVNREERLYKTGDLARWLPDGNIEFLGRIDHQVNIRGFRIELGEIENQLMQHELIREAIVIDKDTEAGDKYLCAYIVSERELTVAELREYLLSYLPEYMVPSYFIRIDEMPVTSNGKLDKRALPEPQGVINTGVEYVESRNELERILVNIWEDVLDVSPIGINDDFFDLGGHSLKATALVSKIHKELDVKIPLKVIFENPSIREISYYINNSDKNTYISIEMTEEKEYYELSSAQKRMYIVNQINREEVMYNMPLALKLEGNLELYKLSDTFKALIKRHEALRTSFIVLEEPVQKIHREVDFNIEQIVLDNSEDIFEGIKKFIKPFDLSKAPLLRAGLIKSGDNTHIMIIDMHHIISDGISVNILVSEFIKLYNGMKIPEIKLQYKDYAEWQQRAIKSGKFRKQESYWLERFNGEIPVLNMPNDFKRPSVQSFEGDTVSFSISKSLKDKLYKITKEVNGTLYITLLTAYNILLYKYTGQEDIVIGSPITGRPHDDLEGIMGMFVNTLAMRNNPKGNKTFREFLIEVKQSSLKAYENQDYQFESLVEKLDIRRDASRNPLFDTMFVLDKSAVKMIELDELYITQYNIDSNISKFDFTVTAVESTENILFNIEYCTKLFKRETMEMLGKHFKEILQQISERPEVNLSNIEILTANEKEQLLKVFNATQQEYPRNKTIHQLFAEQVEKTPDNIAVVYEDKELTYKELNEMSNSLARVLVKEGGEAHIVGIMVERSIEVIVGILGVLKAGGAYLPIDINYPQDRISYMLEDSNCRILLTKSDYNRLDNFDGSLIDLMDKEIYNEDSSEICNNNKPEDLAYVIYTSGSTGQPKGTLIKHSGVVNYLTWAKNEYVRNEQVNFPLFTSISFDLTITSIFTPLITGNSIVIYKGEEYENLVEKILTDNKVEAIKLTPSHLKMIRHREFKQSKLKRLILGGEELEVYLAKEIYNKFKGNIDIYNEYGPTETVVGCTAYIFKPDEDKRAVPIGKPISNTQIYILDKDRQLLPVGVSGEMYISGEGLAIGYLNKPELTSKRFVENPFINGSKMYKTGDLARWLSDGNIEFLGRIDHQIKIRGHRIELGEIENKLLRYKDINEIVVIAREDKNKDSYLCGYIVGDKEIVTSELREYLSGQFPDYMIPLHFIQIEEMPLTVNGKIDRTRLPEPDGKIAVGAVYEAPRNLIEERLVKIWETLFDIKNIGINDNFFELGGHSLKATTLVAKIHKELNVDVPLKEVFTRSNIRNISEYINNASKNLYSSIKSAEYKEHYDLSSAQRRMFIINQFNKDVTNYNMSSVFELEGKLDISRLENTFRKLIIRHESLRTSFMLIEEELVQRIHKEIDFKVEYTNMSEKNTEEFIQENVRAFIRPFDLSKAPLFRVGLVKVREDKHFLIIDIHHIISDGVSSNILTGEFSRIYNGECLPELRIQYKDYALWQQQMFKTQEFEKQKKYWLERFKGEIPVLNMFTDYHRPIVQSFEGDSINFRIDKGLKEKLYQITKENNGTLYITLLAVYNTLLYKYTKQEDIIVGSPIAGRHHGDLDNIIGMFVNTLAMRNYPKGDKTFIELLNSVKENAFRAYENQDYQFEELVENLDIKRDASRNPLFDTMFILQNMDRSVVELEGLRISPYDLKENNSRMDIILTAIEDKDDIVFNVEYCTKLFRKETIERLRMHFVNILKEIVSNPYIELDNIDMISSEEKNKLIFEFNNTTLEYQRNKTIHQLFEEQVEKTPDNIALVFEDKYLTYKELNERANSLGNFLRKQGVEPNTLVGLMLDRSMEMIISIIGILKSGGAYLPIDVNYPLERIKYILKDSEAYVLVTDKDIVDKLDLMSLEGTIVDVYNDVNYAEYKENLDNINTAENLAYTIYTSGSTGNPKGVMIEHRNFINYNNSMTTAIDFSEGKVIGMFTTISFDLSIFETLLPLVNGVKVVIANKDEQNNPSLMKQMIIKNGIDMLSATPTRLKSLVYDMEDLQNLTCLKEIMIGGDIFPIELLELLKRNINAKVYNLYGPTEATVWATLKELTFDDKISIGRPIGNTKIFILDSGNKITPIGVPGEICISGENLGRGYLNKPELTSQKFIENPFIPGEKLYKTGDLGRWLANGDIEFLGRIDNQVKIRGYRIELGEIENQMLIYSKVKEAVVVEKEDSNREKYLCGYIVLENPEEELTSIELRRHLKDKLPDYMIPEYFVQLRAMPVNSNGKVDRKLLPEPAGRLKTGAEFEEARNQTEEVLVALWKEVLGVEQVGINDNFFELGGNSLKAIRIISALEKLQLNIRISDIFRYQTIKEISNIIHNYDDLQLLNSTIEIESLILNIIGVANRFIQLSLFGENYNILLVEKQKLTSMEGLMKFIIKNVSTQSQPHYICCIDNPYANMNEVDLIKLLDLKNDNIEEAYRMIKEDINKQQKDFENVALSREIIHTYPLASVQKGFLESNAIYSGTEILLNEFMDIDILTKSIVYAINKHSLLRSTIELDKFQYLWHERGHLEDISIPFIDISMYDGNSRDYIRKCMNLDFYFGSYEIIGRLLYRLVIIRENNKLHRIRFAFHHSVFDEISGDIIEKDIKNSYIKIKNNLELSSSEKNYCDYVHQIRRGPENISENNIILDYKLNEFYDVLSNINAYLYRNGINKFKNFVMYFDISKLKLSKSSETMFDLSILLLKEICEKYLNSTKLPLYMFYYGRKYKHSNFFEYVGAFIDFIPVFMDLELLPSSQVQYYIQNKINTSSMYNINFVSLMLDDELKARYAEVYRLINPFRNIPLIFNYHGEISESKLELGNVLTNMYDQLQDRDIKQSKIQGMLYDISYTSDTLKVILHFPENITQEDLEHFVSSYLYKLCDIEGVEQIAISKDIELKE